MRSFLAFAALILLTCSSAFAQTTPPPTRTVTLTWNTQAGVTFNVYRWTTGQNGFQKINTAPVTTPTYNDATAVVGGAYGYKVSAVSPTAGESAQSPEVDITILAVPATPTGLKVSVVITN